MTDTTTTTAAPADTTAAPAAAPGAPAAPAPAAAPAAPAGHGIAWLPADADPELVGHVQNAGWQSPADAAKSHRELQKLFGADRHGRTVVMPKDDATPQELAEFYTKLGRPPNPEGYNVKPPEGTDPSFAKGFAAKAYELGLSAKQAETLAAWYGEAGAGMTQAQDAAQQEALAAEHAQLAKDWGNGTEAQMRRELSRRAAIHLGLDEGAIDALEKSVGFAKTMKALAKMGDLIREHDAAGMGEMGSYGMTPEGARDRKGQLFADPAWRAKAMNPQSSEWRELQKLDRIIAGVTQ